MNRSSNTPGQTSNGQRSSAPTTKKITLEDQLRLAFQQKIPIQYADAKDRYTVVITEDPVKAIKERRSIVMSPVANPAMVLTTVKPDQTLSDLPTVR